MRRHLGADGCRCPESPGWYPDPDDPSRNMYRDGRVWDRDGLPSYASIGSPTVPACQWTGGTAHWRTWHRDRRGRTGPSSLTTRRDRPKPHRASTPSGHDGHDSSPAANRDSTRTRSTSTVTISASEHYSAAPRQAGQDFSGVPCTHQFLDTLTAPTTKIKPRSQQRPHRHAQRRQTTPWSSFPATVNTPMPNCAPNLT
jgi:hypothetical protein